jgi:hypothetical protein
MRYHVIPSRSDGLIPPHRPSPKELWKKLKEAKSLVKNGKWFPVSPAKLQANWDGIEEDFNIDTTLAEDQIKILLTSLEEIKADDYCGFHPPEPSYEGDPNVKGQEMWAFCWDSPFFGNTRMYFKFCFTKSDESSRKLGMLSIHPSKPR